MNNEASRLINRLLTGRLTADQLSASQRFLLTSHVSDEINIHGFKSIQQQMTFSKASYRLELMRAFVQGYIDQVSDPDLRQETKLTDKLHLRLLQAIYQAELNLFLVSLETAKADDRYILEFITESQEWARDELKYMSGYVGVMLDGSEALEQDPEIPAEAVFFMITDFNHRRTILKLRNQILNSESEQDQVKLLISLKQEILQHKQSIDTFIEITTNEVSKPIS